MGVKGKKGEKVQKTVHFNKAFSEMIEARIKLTDRTYSAEIEHMCKKQVEHESEANRRALLMAEKGTQKIDGPLQG